MPSTTIHAVVPETAHVGPVSDWLKVHRTVWKLSGDIVNLDDGLRLTAPRRTLFDLASRVTQFRFDRAAEDLWHLELISPAEMCRYLEIVRRSGRGGVARVEAWLERTGARARPSQSWLE